MKFAALQELSEATRNRTDEAFASAESQIREKMISKIEGVFGTLETLAYSKLSTEDISKIFFVLVEAHLTRQIVIPSFVIIAKKKDLERYLGA